MYKPNVMELIKLDLASKNNVQNGFYLYIPIVKVGGSYFRCNSIKSDKVLKANDISIESLVISKEIEPKFYEANGIRGVKVIKFFFLWYSNLYSYGNN